MAGAKRRTEFVGVRMEPAELEMLKELADADGLYPSDVVRTLVRRAHATRFSAVARALAHMAPEIQELAHGVVEAVRANRGAGSTKAEIAETLGVPESSRKLSIAMAALKKEFLISDGGGAFGLTVRTHDP